VLLIVLFPLIRWACLAYARLLAGLFLFIIRPIRTTRAAKEAVATYIRGPHPVLRWVVPVVAWLAVFLGLLAAEMRLSLVPELHNREGLMVFGALAAGLVGVPLVGWRGWRRGRRQNDQKAQTAAQNS